MPNPYPYEIFHSTQGFIDALQDEFDAESYVSYLTTLTDESGSLVYADGEFTIRFNSPIN